MVGLHTLSYHAPGPCETLLGADFIPRVKPHLLKLEPRAPDRDKPPEPEDRATRQRLVRSTERVVASNRKCASDALQKTKMLGEIGSVLGTVCGQDTQPGSDPPCPEQMQSQATARLQEGQKSTGDHEQEQELTR